MVSPFAILDAAVLRVWATPFMSAPIWMPATAVPAGPVAGASAARVAASVAAVAILPDGAPGSAFSTANSAGTFGFPVETAADVALRAVRDYLLGETGIERVTFVLRPDALEAFRRRLPTI